MVYEQLHLDFEVEDAPESELDSDTPPSGRRCRPGSSVAGLPSDDTASALGHDVETSPGPPRDLPGTSPSLVSSGAGLTPRARSR